MSLDRVVEILSWGPTTELDPVRFSKKMQVWRVVFMIGVKAMVNSKLDRKIAASATGNGSSTISCQALNLSLQHEDAIEMYYNAAITGWLNLAAQIEAGPGNHDRGEADNLPAD